MSCFGMRGADEAGLELRRGDVDAGIEERVEEAREVRTGPRGFASSRLRIGPGGEEEAEHRAVAVEGVIESRRLSARPVSVSSISPSFSSRA